MIVKKVGKVIRMTSESDHLRFKHPFTATVAGPTSSGKTVFVRRLLTHHRSLTTIGKGTINVIWCYGSWQSSYTEEIPGCNIHYHQGLVTIDQVKKLRPHMIVIDDLMNECAGNPELSAFFTKHSHHEQVSDVFIIQNLFYQAKEMRNISLNSHYVVAMKNPRDREQLLNFAKQMYSGRRKVLEEVFNDAFKKPFSYILFDFKNDTPESMRLRTRLFPEENKRGKIEPIVYMLPD